MASSNRDLPNRRKLALIIGNDNYSRPDNKLTNSSKNAKDLSNLLKTINFDVTIAYNLNKHEMTTGIIDFSKMVCDGDLILFYFSGHGYQANEKNYLMPVDDTRIETNRDVEDFAINLELTLARLIKKNPSYVTILILDCCRPYVLQSASTATSVPGGNGLHEMKVSNGAFIQFAGAANRIVYNDLFTKHLLKNITQANVNITDVFRRIEEDVFQESNKKQRPWSMNGLSRHEHIYLHPAIVPPECPLDEVNQNEVGSILKKQAELRAYYDNFPNIDDITNRNKSNIQKAEVFTQSILSELPSGNVTERDTACHVLYSLLGQDNGQCLFFDSTQGMTLHDASGNLNDLSFQDRPFVLKLSNINGLGNQKYKKDDQYDLRLIKTMDRMVEKNESNPIIEDIIERLCKAHNIDRKNISFTIFYNGSFNIVYTVKDLANNIIKTLTDISRKLMGQFEQFIAAKIHPLLYRPSFDISQFDVRGNKTFSNEAETFELGPPGRTQTYTQPPGWTRYGLKVLGKYQNDEWLHPFRHAGNWYRAYHGTGNASAVDFGNPNASIDKFASVDAAASIFEKGFRPARVHVHGNGVYCSPNPTFPEKGYVTNVALDTKHGKKTFKCMLQVAVNPYGVKIANNDIWVVEDPKNIRTYGILIKEA